MTRTIIQSSIMALVVLAAAVGISAQSSIQYRAEIPFSFEARGQQHASGTYRLEMLSPSSSAIALRDVDRGKMSVLSGNSVAGNQNWNKPGTLTFQKVNGKYVLQEISTPTFSLAIKRSKTGVRDVANIASLSDVVTIYLN